MLHVCTTIVEMPVIYSLMLVEPGSALRLLAGSKSSFTEHWNTGPLLTIPDSNGRIVGTGET
jgi:hypothetical protein